MLRTFDEGSDDVAELATEAPLELAVEGRSTPDAPESDASSAEPSELSPGAPADPMDDAVSALRSLVLAVERYRTSVSSSAGVGTTESQAISFLGTHGDRGQSELARELNLTSSAATALVDRLERRGVAERVRHPSDRRRTIIRLTPSGGSLAERVHQPLYASLDAVGAEDLPVVSRWMSLIADGLVGTRPDPA